MSDPMHELITRNIQGIFGEGNAERRRATIREIYTEDCVVYVPPGPVTGHAAIDRFAGTLRDSHPDFVYTPIGRSQTTHDAVRQAWGSGPKGQAFAYTGEDVAIVRDGKICALYVFLETPAA